MIILSTNVAQKLLETEFLIAICHPIGDTNGNQKTLFLKIFALHSPIVKSIFVCRLSGVDICWNHCLLRFYHFNKLSSSCFL